MATRNDSRKARTGDGHAAGHRMTAQSETERYTLIYDGDCAVCTRLVGVVSAWDASGVVEVIPSQDPDVAARFPWIPPEALAAAMQLVGPGGETLAGAAAVERLVELLPRAQWFGWVFRLPFAGRAADRLYRWFARNRHRLGCGTHCDIASRGRR